MNEDSAADPPVRLMNFVSEKQSEEAEKTRGGRVDDGTAQRDRPLFEILKENKDRQDAEFNERLKHSTDPKPVAKKSQPAWTLSMINITVKPQVKKAKTEATTGDKPQGCCSLLS
ncbi:uncharacterized protein [Aristolochia californica]|uniref:uncharacterized protein n=1 Tax=Aristolochia californica TaxID=171875 RepID=UPI0035D80A90